MARAHGIDISHNQGSFNLAIKGEDIQFVIIRASNGTFKDRRFKKFLKGIAEVPIRGAYHYFRSFKSPAIQDPNKEFPWQEQADLFLELVRGKGFHFLALDFEQSPEFAVDWTVEKKRDNILSEAFAEDAQKWLSYVDKETIEPVVIYTNQPLYQTWLKPVKGMEKWPLWIAQYHARPDRETGKPDLPDGVAGWKIWQYSADGNMKGKEYGVGSAHIDLDVYDGTLEEMRQWLKIGIVEEEPKKPDKKIEPPTEEPKKPEKKIEPPTEGTDEPEDEQVLTWGDVRAATREVAKRRGALAASWFREASIRDEMKDKKRRKKPYDGKPVEKWLISPSEDRDQILAEILAQLGQKQGESDDDHAEPTWGDVRAATRKVAKRRGAIASTWFREAGIRDEMKDKSRRKQLYDGKPVEDWQISPSEDRDLILAEILALLGLEQSGLEEFSFAQPDFEQFSFEVGVSGDGDAVKTWGDVRAATRAVAKSRGALAATWFREAGIRDQMKDKSRRNQPYNGKPVEEWPLSPSEDRDQILAEILAQLGQKQGESARVTADVTWGDVRAATRKVAKKHGVLAATWFREAGIRNQMKDKARREKPYDGEPINSWSVSITLRAEIINNLDKKKQILIDLDPGGDQGVLVPPKGDLIKLDVPYISQYDPEAGDHSADCGPTCLAMIIRADPAPDHPVTVDELYNRHLQKHKGNTLWHHLDKMGSGENLTPERKSNEKAQALEDIKTLIRNGHPTIVLVKYGHWPFVTKNKFDGFHFVLVTGFDEENIYVHDPLFGGFSSRRDGAYCQLSNDTFLKGWDFPESGNTPRKRIAMTNKVVPFLSD